MISNETVTHFGIKYVPKSNYLKLTKDVYIKISNKSSFGKNLLYKRLRERGDFVGIKELGWDKKYSDNEGSFYTEEWCNKQYNRALINFDLNMEFYKRLNHEEFNNEIKKFIKNTKFSQIKNLSRYDIRGYYVMILDEYCQVYIGTADNIKKRIKQHWTKRVSFDRLIFGDVYNSILSIDSFGILDTTRILIKPDVSMYVDEDDYINMFSPKFVCNRMAGGRAELGTISMFATRKTRNLNE